MKVKVMLASAAMVCLSMVATVSAQQTAQEYSFASQDGRSPPSTLRVTEQPQAGTAPAPVIRDTKESLATYTRCRNDADRASVGHLQLQAMITACLRELEERRQP
jgi:hypothetical protein